MHASSAKHLAQVRPAVELQYLLVVALKLPRGLVLPEYPAARAQEHLVKLALVVAAVPPLPVEGLQGLAARAHALEPGRRALHDAPPLGELLHGAEHGLGGGRLVRAGVGVVDGLEGDGHARGAFRAR